MEGLVGWLGNVERREGQREKLEIAGAQSWWVAAVQIRFALRLVIAPVLRHKM